MKFINSISLLIWTILTILYGALASRSQTFHTKKGNNIYLGNENNLLDPAKYSNKPRNEPTRRKRQVELQIKGIQHIYENPQKNYDSMNVGNRRYPMEFGSSFPRELSGQATSSQSNTMASKLENPQVNWERIDPEENNIQSSPQDMAEHSNSNSDVTILPSKDAATISATQPEAGSIQSARQEQFHSEPSLLNLPRKDTLFSSSSQVEDLHTANPTPHLGDSTVPNFIHSPHYINPTFNPSIPHDAPVIYPDSGPMVINPLGPDNLHIIKKLYPLPVVQKVPKPIPVTDTKLVPYPVHQKKIRYIPQPYPQPVSKPDVHLSYIHLENRGRMSLPRANPCKHGGIIVQSPGGYVCLCRKAFKGKHCQERDRCYPYPCENDGDCIDHGTHYECKCPRGYKGIHCEVADKCHHHPCRNGATCVQLISKVKCVCSAGYKGKYCQDVDHCHPNPCRHGGTCEELNQAASCTCTPSFKGSRCQVPKTCTLNLCRNGGTCLEDKPSSPCVCAPGFSGRYCTDNVCEPSPCQHNGKCYPIRSDFNSTWYAACKCSAMYKGDLCQVPNPCASNPSPCVHGICYDAYTNVDQVNIPPEGYLCHCYQGYFGINCQSRKCDHCDLNARCLDGFKCTCNEGYQGNGQECQKIPDPCVPNPCENGGLCHADLNAFECRCIPGFKGKTCQDKAPCAGVISPCKNGGTCIEERNDFRCICPREWKGKDCSENATSLCSGNRCLNGGTCRVSEDGKSWYCVCRGARFKPPDCACNCPTNAHTPSQRNLTCNNPQGLCVCPQGFTRDRGREVCIDESAEEGISGKSATGCVPNPCKNGGKCVSLSSSKWMCECSRGWTGKICDVKAPIEPKSSCVPNPCENGGTCSVVNGTAVCECPEGFLPPICEVKGRTACAPDPCLNKGRCIRVGDAYDCICDQRFTGPNCEVDRCLKCDPVNALCNLGQCTCKTGFIGNGYQCLPEKIVTSKKVNVCVLCHPVKAICVDNTCQCKSGFIGDGYECTGSHPGSIQYLNSPNNQQIPWFKRSKVL